MYVLLSFSMTRLCLIDSREAINPLSRLCSVRVQQSRQARMSPQRQIKLALVTYVSVYSLSDRWSNLLFGAVSRRARAILVGVANFGQKAC